MYIYDVEYVRGGQGGALTLEIGQNRGFGRGLAQPSSPHSLTWWVKWLNPFAYHLATLGEQFQSKEPLYNVYWGWLRANNHQKKGPKMGFFDFDHSEVEKTSVKEVNGNRTAQAVMDWELKSKRRTSSGEKRTNVTQSSTKVELVHGHFSWILNSPRPAQGHNRPPSPLTYMVIWVI